MENGDFVSNPKTYARVGGILYFLIIVAALFGETYVRGTLIVSGDAAATAQRIAHSEFLYRAGIAAEMLTCVFDVALSMILYVLLKPINRNLALLGAFFRLTFVAVYSVAKLFEIAALNLLGHGDYLKAFEPQQLYAQAYVFVRLHDLSYGASLLFFGCCTALFGYLIYKSRYIPATIGGLLVIAGIGYFVFSLSQMLSPAFAGKVLFPWLLLPGFFGELALSLWLLIKGVDSAKWEQRVAGK